jgi:hypothetical protein
VTERKPNNVNEAINVDSTNLNGCFYQAQNLVSVPHSIVVRCLVNIIPCNSARYSAYKDLAVTAVLLWMRQM